MSAPGSKLPETLGALRSWLQRQIVDITNALQNGNPESVTLQELHAEPDKYRDGMVVFADGTDWNPGSGRGAYIRYGAAWNKLG